MSAVHVTKINQYQYLVDADDRYDVAAHRDEHDWWINPAIDSRAIRSANLRTRADADAWAARTTWGPYRSAAEAVRVLGGVL